MSSNVTRFPNHQERRARKHARAFQVPCQVSPRWLQFPKQAAVFPNGDFMKVDVMTNGSDDQPRKLCELVLTKQDLLRMLEQVESKRDES